jgi:hypothetical protein
MQKLADFMQQLGIFTQTSAMDVEKKVQPSAMDGETIQPSENQ